MHKKYKPKASNRNKLVDMLNTFISFKIKFEVRTAVSVVMKPVINPAASSRCAAADAFLFSVKKAIAAIEDSCNNKE